MVTGTRALLLGLALLAAASRPVQAQYESELRGLDPGALRKAAVHDIVAGFNRLGSHAADLKTAMTAHDADAFDAVLLEIMSGLIALPEFGLRNSGDPDLIRPAKPRSDVVARLGSDLRVLEGLLARLQSSASSAAQVRMFNQARKDARKVSVGLQQVLPLVSVTDVAAK